MSDALVPNLQSWLPGSCKKRVQKRSAGLSRRRVHYLRTQREMCECKSTSSGCSENNI